MKTTRRILSMLLCLALVLGVIPVFASAAEETATLSFADKAQRTSFTTSAQIWEQNGITFTNNKGSGSNIADYAKPVRLYKNSELIVALTEGNTITKIEFTCNSSSYATALNSSIGNTDTHSVSGSVVTVTPAAAANTYTIASLSGGQVRMDSLTVYYTAASEGGETPACDHAESKLSWNNDETQHWQECSCGDYTTTPADHDFTNSDTCECGYKIIPTNNYEKITTAEQLVSGKYVMIVSSGYASGVFDSVNDWVTAGKPTVSGDVCTAPDSFVWTLAVNGASVTLTDSNGVSIAPKGGNNNGIIEDTYNWAWAFADGTFTFSGTGSDTVILAGNTQYGNQFRAYKTTTVSGEKAKYPHTFTLYKLVEETPAVPKVEKTSSRFGETLSLIFGYKKSELGDDYAGLTAYITKNGVTTPTTEWTTKTIDNEVYCLVELSGILAKEMTEQVSIVVKDAEGNVVTEEKTTSLREYAMSVLAGDFNNATKTMIVDMLNYGAAAQSYFKYNEDNLANALLEDSHKQLASELKAVENDRVGNVGEVFGGSALRFDDEISMIFRFKNTEGTYAKLTWKDHYGVDQTVTVQSTEYTYDEDGWTMIELNEKLVVADGRSNITCEIRNVTNDELVISVTDSIQAYVARSEGTDANALSVAFMKFSDSAKDYLANK
ncbi:MAG: hypothetical protein E7468_05530 [Ruminococcaceae bacterium]|nr:hypothetical protein [Oscillospiraceae bacterium]